MRRIFTSSHPDPTKLIHILQDICYANACMHTLMFKCKLTRVTYVVLERLLMLVSFSLLWQNVWKKLSLGEKSFLGLGVSIHDHPIVSGLCGSSCLVLPHKVGGKGWHPSIPLEDTVPKTWPLPPKTYLLRFPHLQIIPPACKTASGHP